MLKNLNSSIGKKYLMGITGQCLCAFLVVHLAGNLTLFAGKDMFNEYAHKLHSLGVLIYIAEVGLIAIFLMHLVTALKLAVGNSSARPQKYAVYNSRGERSWASSTMIVSGLIVVVFLVIHIIQFKFADRSGGETLYDVVFARFQQLPWAAFYVVSIGCLSMHLSHGFQSAFQSLGLNHPKYTPMIKSLGTLYAVLMGVGYTVIPLWMHFAKGGIS